MPEEKPGFADSARSSFRLDTREERIHRRLLLVGPGPAAFFRDACVIMRGEVPIASSSHIVGHLLREVESAIRAVLKSMSGLAEGETSGGQHRREIAQVLKALEISEDDPVGRAWLRLSEKTEEYALHRLAHRDSLAAPRPIDEQFRSFWDETCTLLDVVLGRFESRYLALLPSIDSLLAKHDPTREDANILRNNVPNNLATLGRFFATFESPKWLVPLRDEGFFSRPPEPILNEEESTVSFSPWPPSRCLIRMATVEPELVASIAADVPLTDNINVHIDLLDVALALPSNLAAGLIPQFRHAVGCAHRSFLFTHKLDVLIRHFVACPENHEAALGLIKAVFDFTSGNDTEPPTAAPRRHSRPRTQLDLHEYERILRNTGKDFVSHCGSAALNLYCDLLDRAVSCEEQEREKPDHEDWSYIWCKDVCSCSGEHDSRCALVDAIRVAARYLVEENRMTTAECVGLLEKRSWKVFGRIALHVLTQFPDEHLAAERLLRRTAFDDLTLAREYNGLLEKSFGRLKPEEQQIILGWIEEGVNTKEYCDRAEQFSGQRPSGDEARNYLEQWRLRHLHPICDSLPSDWRARYDGLIGQYGVPQLYHPGPSVSWGWRSPLNADQLHAMSAEEIVAFLKTWEPGPDMHTGPSRKGLSDELEKVVASDAARFVHASGTLVSLEPSYLVGILTGFERATKTAWRPEFWPPILCLCKAVCARTFNTPVIDEDEDAERATRWVRQAVESLVSAGLRQGEAQLPIELRKSVWDILIVVSDDPEPTMEVEADEEGNCDPFTRSLNTVRGKALHAVLDYALWVRRHQPPTEAEATFDDMPEVVEILNRHVDTDASPAIRSIYGESFPRLWVLDKSWAASHVEGIFPSAPEQRNLWDAAWQSYIVFCRPYDAIFQLLRVQYVRAIRELGREAPYRVAGNADHKEQLAVHLMVFYGRGVITLEDDDLVSLFFTRAPLAVRRHALAFIGRSLREEEDDIPTEVLERFQQLWQRRVDVLKGAGIGEEIVELSEFGWWFISGKLDTRWSLDRLRESLNIYGRSEPDHFVIEKLASVVQQFPAEAVECFSMLVDGDRNGWAISSGREHAKAILAAALSSGVEPARRAARELINRLYARGFQEFRGLLDAA